MAMNGVSTIPHEDEAVEARCLSIPLQSEEATARPCAYCEVGEGDAVDDQEDEACATHEEEVVARVPHVANLHDEVFLSTTCPSLKVPEEVAALDEDGVTTFDAMIASREGSSTSGVADARGVLAELTSDLLAAVSLLGPRFLLPLLRVPLAAAMDDEVRGDDEAVVPEEMVIVLVMFPWGPFCEACRRALAAVVGWSGWMGMGPLGSLCHRSLAS